jgi:toxin ParE1/3/4
MVEYAIEITPSAARDIDEAFDYIAFHLENPQAAFDLTDAIYLGIGELSSMPERFPRWKREPMKSRGVRFLGIKNFNVFYTVDKASRRVSVIRVIYNRRNV